MVYFMIRVMLSVFSLVIYYNAADIFQTVKTPTFELSRYLAVITIVINTHIDNITLKVLFSNIHQRSKAHFLVITHRGTNAILEVNLNKQ